MPKPTIKEILKAMPHSQCLDSEEDASVLASIVCLRLGMNGRTGAVFNEINGLPWCSDNEAERKKIAIKIRGVL